MFLFYHEKLKHVQVSYMLLSLLGWIKEFTFSGIYFCYLQILLQSDCLGLTASVTTAFK